MNPTLHAQILTLKKYQAWRKGENTRTMDEAGIVLREITSALDAVIAIAEDHLRDGMEKAKYSEQTRECSEVTGYTAEDMASAAAQGFRDGVRAASNLIAKLDLEASNDTPEPCQHEWSIVTAWENKGQANMDVVCTKCKMTGSVAL